MLVPIVREALDELGWRYQIVLDGHGRTWACDLAPDSIGAMDQIRVIAAVVRDGDRLLICQRPTHKRHGGLWEFPGGKCEPGESDAEAARRELQEELAVEVSAVGSEEFAIADPGSPFLIAFVPVRITGTPTCHEHTALTWGTVDEITALPLAPSDRRYVEHLRACRGA